MEERKRTIFAVIIALVIVIALLYSFGMNLFSDSPQLTLPDPDVIESQEPNTGVPGEAAGVPVEVAPNTVQSVIAQLSRYESYSRTVIVTYFWGGGESETLSSQVWEDGGWTRVDTTLSSGVRECVILGDGTQWLWYDDGTEDASRQIFTGAVKEGASDLTQRLPTYEDVLELDAAHITGAAYVEYEGQPCIYVEAEQQVLGYLYRYWISVSNGLLMAAETEKSGMIVYRMNSNEVISPMAADGQVFVLPDGTSVHEAVVYSAEE